MKFLVSLLLAVFAATPMLASAEEAVPGSVAVSHGQGKMRGSQTTVLQGTITEIDGEARRLTVHSSNGNEATLVAGPEVKNFAQLKVGDTVTLKFVQSLALELKKDGKVLRERVEGSDAASAQAGELPAGVGVRSVHVVADVMAVDMKNGLVTLRGPQRQVDLKVREKAVLSQVAVGDQLDVTYLEALAVAVYRNREAQ